MDAEELSRFWTPEDVATLLDLVAKGLTNAEIARRLRMPRHRIDSKLAKMGDEAQRARAAHQDALVIDLPKAGVRIVSTYQASWNPFEHHMVAA